MALLTEKTSGVLTIGVTPFSDTGALDLESTDRVTDFYLEKGCAGITILGVQGEAAKLSPPEVASFAKRVVQRAGNAPVVVGVSGPNLSILTDLTKAVMDLGAAGVLIAAPYGPQTDGQVYGYYEGAAEAIGPDVPWVLMDEPRTQDVWMSVDVVARIIGNFPNCVAIKHEDNLGLGLAKITALRTLEKEKGLRRVGIFGGSGGLWVFEEYERGSDGAMTGFAYPEMMVDVQKAHVAGDKARAAELFEAYLPLARYEAQPRIGTALRKYILHKRGAIASPTMRKPIQAPSRVDIEQLEFLLARQESRLKTIGGRY